MIRAFWQSRLAAGGIFAFMAGLAVFVWIRDRGLPFYIPLLATVMLLALGAVSGRLAGNILASHLNAKCLALLHVKLDPAAFLAKYEPVPARLAPGSQSHAVACAYLADGYAAGGEYDKAIAALCRDFTGKKGEDLALKGLYYNNLAAYRLGAQDAAGAGEALEELAGVVEACRTAKPAFAQNMESNLRFYKNWQALLAGGKVEGEWLAAELPKAPYQLRKLELLKVLALYELKKGRLGRAREHLEALVHFAGKTCYGPWAEEALARLPERS